ncbi:hypothetical protein BH10BAC1_BH10BAC1_02770 [soil metagenome]
MKKRVFYFLMISIIFMLSTCKYDAYNPDVCFQEDVLPIFVSNCAVSGCHNSTDHEAGYDFSNYDGIMKGVVANHPQRSEVYTVISGANPSMPPGGANKLSKKELNYIKIWIKMGAKNSSNCSNCDTTSFTFNGRIQPLINSWCTGCHSGASAGGGYDLTTYTGVAAIAASGQLLGSVQHLAGYSAMPKGTSKLSDCDVKAIEKWVAAGYLEN